MVRSVLVDERLLAIYSRAAPGHQAGLIQTLANAGAAIRAGRHCDLCPERALLIRFFAIAAEELATIRPDADIDRRGMVGFALLCLRCNELSQPELHRQVLEQIGPLRAANGKPRSLLNVLIGKKVGEPGELPQRHSLRPCDDCGATLWIDADQEEYIDVATENTLFLCRDCAAVRAQHQNLDIAPPL
jgi:hypothetical protein